MIDVRLVEHPQCFTVYIRPGTNFNLAFPTDDGYLVEVGKFCTVYYDGLCIQVHPQERKDQKQILEFANVPFH
jgi:hypothetical protein